MRSFVTSIVEMKDLQRMALDLVNEPWWVWCCGMMVVTTDNRYRINLVNGFYELPDGAYPDLTDYATLGILCGQIIEKLPLFAESMYGIINNHLDWIVALKRYSYKNNDQQFNNVFLGFLLAKLLIAVNEG